MGAIRRILLATDFGPSSQRALEMALEMATTFGAELAIVHACELPAYAYAGAGFSPVDLLAPMVEAAKQQLDAVVASARARWPRISGEVRIGVPWEIILESASDARADLVVTGTHGRRGVAHALIGSVAEKVVRMSPVPVLTVRADQPRTS